MEKSMTRRGGRSLSSTLRKVISLGACSALMATGVLLATATAASAAGTPTKVVFTVNPTSPTTAGAPLSSFSVSIEDATSAVETTGASSTDTITITSTCTLAGTLSMAAVAGVATFATGVAINTGTSCTLIATDTTENLTTDTSSAVTVNPTTLAKVGFTTPPTSPAVSGNNMATFRVATEDTYGNVITSGVAATDTIAITSACTLGGTLSAAAVAGVATFSTAIIYGGTSPCTLTATDSSRALTTAVSSGVTVTAGIATKVGFTTQPPATVVASAVLATFKVSVEDAYGNVETTGTDATDTIALTPSTGCTFGGTTSAAAVAGVATFSALTITSTGSCTLTATDSTHVLTAAVSSAVDSQGAQAALVVSSVTGYLGSPLTLTTAGGSGTGAVTFTAVPGTALGCVVTGTSLTVTSLGTCIVTATKAASLTNLAVSSVATTVTFVKPFKAVRVVGFVVAGKTSTIRIIGTAFSGRPKVTSHAGTTAIVTKDTGTSLTVKVTVKAGTKNGTYTFTVKLANGKTSKVKYVQRA
jgi:hypothetical protein